MKLKKLLTAASRMEPLDVCNMLQDAFGHTRPFAGLPLTGDNPDYAMEADGPYARFELNFVISNYYIMSLSPEIRNGTVGIGVRLQYMKDGYGMQSQSWETHGDGEYEDFLDGEDDETVAQLAARAKSRAIEYHASLVESVGIPRAAAAKAAKAAWKVVKS